MDDHRDSVNFYQLLAEAFFVHSFAFSGSQNDGGGITIPVAMRNEIADFFDFFNNMKFQEKAPYGPKTDGLDLDKNPRLVYHRFLKTQYFSKNITKNIKKVFIYKGLYSII